MKKVVTKQEGGDHPLSHKHTHQLKEEVYYLYKYVSKLENCIEHYLFLPVSILSNNYEMISSSHASKSLLSSLLLSPPST
jgi:hypothetical protein